MSSQRLNDDLIETDVDIDDLDLVSSSDSDIFEMKDVVQMSRYTARRRIEDLKEELQLRKNIESYDDWD